MNRKKWVVGVLFVLFAVGVFSVSPSVSLAEQKKFRYGYLSPPTFAMGRTSEFFKDYIEKHTGGAITIELYPLAQLGGMRAMFDQVMAGTLDMATVASPLIATAFPEFNVLNLPFVVYNVDVMWEILWTKDFRDKLDNAVRKKGIEPLFVCDNGARGFLNKKREVRSPEDMKGLKMRVMQGSIYTDMFRAMGAKTRTMPFPEVYTALQQGLIDGEDNSLEMAVAMKFVEIEKFWTPLNQTMIVVFTLGSGKMWDSLTEEQKKIFNEAKVAVEKQSKIHMAEDAEAAIPIAKEKYGVKIGEPPTAAELAQFRKAVEPVLEKYRNVIGPDVFDHFVKLAKEYEGKYAK